MALKKQSDALASELWQLIEYYQPLIISSLIFLSCEISVWLELKLFNSLFR